MNASLDQIEIGVDVGGTFTDFVCRFPDHSCVALKVPSDRKDPGQAVLGGLLKLAAAHQIQLQNVTRFTHGTTVATNAVIERTGAKIALLTTAGFRDVLEIGRQGRSELYQLELKPEAPVFLAPRERRWEIRERLRASGAVDTPLSEQSVAEAVEGLASRGIESVAICLLYSFLDPTHERRAREIVTASNPALAVSISSDVDPAFREYERTVATCFDAYIKPVVDGYLSRLSEGLKQIAVDAPLQVMQSRGGLAAEHIARHRPVRLFLSGPAAGVIGASAAAARCPASALMGPNRLN